MCNGTLTTGMAGLLFTDQNALAEEEVLTQLPSLPAAALLQGFRRSIFDRRQPVYCLPVSARFQMPAQTAQIVTIL